MTRREALAALAAMAITAKKLTAQDKLILDREVEVAETKQEPFEYEWDGLTAAERVIIEKPEPGWPFGHPHAPPTKRTGWRTMVRFSDSPIWFYTQVRADVDGVGQDQPANFTIGKKYQIWTEKKRRWFEVRSDDGKMRWLGQVKEDKKKK